MRIIKNTVCDSKINITAILGKTRRVSCLLHKCITCPKPDIVTTIILPASFSPCCPPLLSVNSEVELGGMEEDWETSIHLSIYLSIYLSITLTVTFYPPPPSFPALPPYPPLVICVHWFEWGEGERGIARHPYCLSPPPPPPYLWSLVWMGWEIGRLRAATASLLSLSLPPPPFLLILPCYLRSLVWLGWERRRRIARAIWGHCTRLTPDVL